MRTTGGLLLCAALLALNSCNKPPEHPSGSGVCNFDTDISDMAVCKKECDAGNEQSCFALGMVSATRGEPTTSQQVLLDSCGRNFHPSCSPAAKHVRDGTGGSPPDAEHAAQLFKKSCEGGNDGAACYELGRMAEAGLGMDKDVAKAQRYYDQACKAGVQQGCQAQQQLQGQQPAGQNDSTGEENSDSDDNAGF
jgi:TPR repeat protein